jgi:hypothetical protein
MQEQLIKTLLSGEPACSESIIWIKENNIQTLHEAWQADELRKMIANPF